MTKAEHIRRLYDGKRTTKEIAEIVGCSEHYVRATISRKRTNYATDKRRNSLAQKAGDKNAASRAGKIARLAAKRAGLSVRDCDRAQKNAHVNTLRKTGRAALRKEAANA